MNDLGGIGAVGWGGVVTIVQSMALTDVSHHADQVVCTIPSQYSKEVDSCIHVTCFACMLIANDTVNRVVQVLDYLGEIMVNELSIHYFLGLVIWLNSSSHHHAFY